MYFGTTNIKEQFLGNTPIKSVWLGPTKIWSTEYTYAIENVKLNYSSGDKILCNGSNYGYITCTLKKYIGDELKETLTNRRMDFEWNSPSIGAYFKKNSDGSFTFNVSEYGTYDMSFHSDPFTTSLIPYMNGLSGSTIYISAEPNAETYSSNNGYEITCSRPVDILSAYSTSFTILANCKEKIICYYKSGKSAEKKVDKTFYVYNPKVTTGPYLYSGTTYITAYISANNNAYPVIHSYRIGHIGVTQDDIDNNQTPPISLSNYDYYLYVAQKSKTTYESGTTQALYYGSKKMGDDYYIETSTDVMIVNDVHSDNIVYEFETNGNIKVEQRYGIIYITGVDSNTDCYLNITTYIPKEKEEWWHDEPQQEKTTLTINIIYS